MASFRIYSFYSPTALLQSLKKYMTSRFKICTDPKHLAWVSWTFLANNPINKTSYLMFCLADLIIIMFYSFVLVQRLHFSNFNYADAGIDSYDSNSNSTVFNTLTIGYTNDTYYKGNGIQLTFLREIDFELNTIVRENIPTLMIFTIVILALSVLTVMVAMIMALRIENHVGLENPSIVKKSICFVLLSITTFLHMPLFDVIVRTIVATQGATDMSLSSQLINYVISAFGIIAFAALMLFLVRIFNICIPSDMVPWCAPVSNVTFLNLLIKAALVVSNATDIEGKYTIVEIIFLFILQGFQACYRVLFAPNYVKEVDLFIKTKDFAVCLVFFIGIICKALGDRNNYDVVYFIIFIPIVTIGWIQFEAYRMQ